MSSNQQTFSQGQSPKEMEAMIKSIVADVLNQGNQQSTNNHPPKALKTRRGGKKSKVDSRNGVPLTTTSNAQSFNIAGNVTLDPIPCSSGALLNDDCTCESDGHFVTKCPSCVKNGDDARSSAASDADNGSDNGFDDCNVSCNDDPPTAVNPPVKAQPREMEAVGTSSDFAPTTPAKDDGKRMKAGEASSESALGPIVAATQFLTENTNAMSNAAFAAGVRSFITQIRENPSNITPSFVAQFAAIIDNFMQNAPSFAEIPVRGSYMPDCEISGSRSDISTRNGALAAVATIGTIRIPGMNFFEYCRGIRACFDCLSRQHAQHDRNFIKAFEGVFTVISMQGSSDDVNFTDLKNRQFRSSEKKAAQDNVPNSAFTNSRPPQEEARKAANLSSGYPPLNHFENMGKGPFHQPAFQPPHGCHCQGTCHGNISITGSNPQIIFTGNNAVINPRPDGSVASPFPSGQANPTNFITETLLDILGRVNDLQNDVSAKSTNARNLQMTVTEMLQRIDNTTQNSSTQIRALHDAHVAMGRVMANNVDSAPPAAGNQSPRINRRRGGRGGRGGL